MTDVFDPIEAARDAIVDEALRRTTGKDVGEHMEEVLDDWGFVPDEPAVEVEHKDIASSRRAETKLKKTLGRKEKVGGTYEEARVRAEWLDRDVDVQVLTGEVEIETWKVEVAPDTGRAEINAVDVEGEGALLREQVQVDGGLWELDPAQVMRPTTFVAVGPRAARVGDPMLHGGVAGPGPGSATVFVGGRPALRLGDAHACTLTTPAPHGAGTFTSAYDRVHIEGRPAIRAGDFVLEPFGGPNPVVDGCPRVTIGPAAPPLDCRAPAVEKRYLVQWRGTAGVDLGYANGKAKGGVKVGADGAAGHVAGELDVAAMRTFYDGSLVVQIPIGIDWDLGPLGRIKHDRIGFDLRPELEARFATAGAAYQKSTGGGQSEQRVGFRWFALGKNKVEPTSVVE